MTIFICRFAIDLGVPIVSVPNLIETAAANYGKSEEYSHPFYRHVKEIVDAGDVDAIKKEKIPLKLLRLAPEAQEGFIMTDYPTD